MKGMVFEYVGRAWEAYRENIVSFIGAELLLFLIVVAIAGIGFWSVFTSLGISSFFQLTPSLVVERIGQILPLLSTLGFVILSFVVALLVDAFLKTGMYGMADEALRGSTEIETMFFFAKERGLVGLEASVIVGIIGFILFVILVGFFGLVFSTIGSLIGLILFFLLMIFFVFTYPGIIVDDLSSTESIKESFKIVKDNYLQVLALTLFYTLLTLVSFIPFVGIFIFYFFVLPMFRISLVFFYKRNRYL